MKFIESLIRSVTEVEFIEYVYWYVKGQLIKHDGSRDDYSWALDDRIMRIMGVDKELKDKYFNGDKAARDELYRLVMNAGAIRILWWGGDRKGLLQAMIPTRADKWMAQLREALRKLIDEDEITSDLVQQFTISLPGNYRIRDYDFNRFVGNSNVEKPKIKEKEQEAIEDVLSL